MEFLAILVILGAIGITIAIYVVIMRETDDPQVVDREAAMREAMELGGTRDSGIPRNEEQGEGGEDRYGWIDSERPGRDRAS